MLELHLSGDSLGEGYFHIPVCHSLNGRSVQQTHQLPRGMAMG
jgi:hypothetical protein